MLKNFGFATIAALAVALCTLPITGCGDGDNEVVELDPAMEEQDDGLGDDPEAYARDMEEQMNQGN